MKKLRVIALCVVLIVSLLAMSSCGVIRELIGAVEYPDVYSLTYEITQADGTVHTITKTVDEDGNVYLKTADQERLYLKDGKNYTLYEKDENGVFVSSGDEKYTAKAVDEATSAIGDYAEQSKNKLMPTAKKSGEDEISGRSCEIYKLGVGNDDNGAYYYYFVDTETGICLGLEIHQTAMGYEVEGNGETFVCTEFITENVEDLSLLIQK